MKIGDPNTETFSEIWHGKNRKEIMEKLDPRKHCEFHCIRHNTNKVLEKIYDAKNFQDKSVDEYDRFI